jgi:hypothetical protein
MIWHCWRCECGAVIEQIGTTSLALAIQTHEQTVHGKLREIGMDVLIPSSQYSVRESLARVDASVPYSQVRGVATPAVNEHIWLRMQGVAWSGDERTAEELEMRYKRKAT